MKKILCIILLAISGLLMAQNKTIVTINGEKLTHDIRMTSDERNQMVAALPPAVGTMIYNLTTHCHEYWDGSGKWFNYCWRGYSPGNPSTGGTGIVSGYVCTTASTGTMTVGTPVNGVKQTLTATVTTVGTYNITAIANGVTFTGTGTFAGTGAQAVELTASGVPTAVGSHSFTLSTTPDCDFDRTTDPPISITTGGTGIVSGYVCDTASTGTMSVGTAVNGVKQTLTATVTTVGTYNITAVANGVTFTGTGTFAGTGAQAVELTASGVPTAVGSHSFTLSTTPGCSFNRATINSVTSGGTGIVSSYVCTTASTGTMTAGTAVNNVTQTITANVTTVGTYNITAVANGVTFSGAGTFAGTGAQAVELTATGMPTADGVHTFALSTTPGCSFDRTTDAPISITTGGTGIVSSYVCDTASTGTMTAGTAVSNVTQTITANVTKGGTYNITAVANGVTFSGAGTFAGTGSQSIQLTATGIPTADGTHSFALSTTPSCNFSRTTNAAISITSHPTANSTVCAGASTSLSVAATGATTYQWQKDGVDISGATGTSLTLSGSATATAGDYVYTVKVGNGTNTVTSNPANLKVNAIPIVSTTGDSKAGGGNVTLYASTSAGTLSWYSSPSGGGAFATGTSYTGTFSATTTFYVEAVSNGCTSARKAVTATIYNSPTSGGTAVFSNHTCSYASGGTMKENVYIGVDVYQTIQVYVQTTGTYDIETTTVNGVKFRRSGSMHSTGWQTIQLNASGTPTYSGTSYFTLNTSPNCGFSRVVQEDFSGQFFVYRNAVSRQVYIGNRERYYGGITGLTFSISGHSSGTQRPLFFEGQSYYPETVHLYASMMSLGIIQGSGYTVDLYLDGVAIGYCWIPQEYIGWDQVNEFGFF